MIEAVAGRPGPVSLAVTLLVVLFFIPNVVPVTVTEKVH